MQAVQSYKIRFASGIPTHLDVDRLIQSLGVPVVGQKVSYVSICEALGLKRNTHRWNTVVTAWRKKLDREHNILLRAVPNDGFEVLDSRGRVDLCGRTYKGGLRRVARAAMIATKTERAGLDPEERRVLDHVAHTGASLRLAAATAAKAMKLPTLDRQAQG